MKNSVVDLVMVKDHRTERLARVFNKNKGDFESSTSAPVVVRLSLGDMVKVTVTKKYGTVSNQKESSPWKLVSAVIGEDKHVTYFTGICLS